MIHHCLKCCWGVDESKIHYQGFKKAIFGLKGHFMFIPLFDVYAVYPHLMSNLENIHVSWTSAISSEIKGSGYLSFIVYSLSF